MRGGAPRSRQTYVRRHMDRVLRFLTLSDGDVWDERRAERHTGSSSSITCTAEDCRQIPVDVLAGVLDEQADLGEAAFKKLSAIC